MRYATAALPNVGAYGVGVAALDNCRRLAGGVAVGLGTISAAGAMAASVAGLAAWTMAGSLIANPGVHAPTSVTLETAALTGPYHRFAGVADLSSLAWLASRSPHAPDLTPVDAARVAAVEAPEPTSDLQGAPPPPPPPVPTSKPRLAAAPSSPMFSFSLFQKTLLAAPSAFYALIPGHAPRTRVADAAPASEADAGAVAAPRKHGDDARLITASLPPQPSRDRSISLAAHDSHTAIYDISAHVVYLPDGERLEAHSGLGFRLDDPRYVRDKARGPTPPNVYQLVLREQLFHGVRAIRLNPVNDGQMYGRDGILAHPYMLGPSGQSFGCVSFRDYQKFLHAFLRGEVDRIVVVPHLQDQPLGDVRTSSEGGGWRNLFGLIGTRS
jgi:hypothetical protein